MSFWRFAGKICSEARAGRGIVASAEDTMTGDGYGCMSNGIALRGAALNHGYIGTQRVTESD
jgi:hypothetical protein